MPGPIEHIDAIACRRGHDVPSLGFHPQPSEENEPLQACYMPLDHAVENAAHDESGFPARSMENV